MFVDTHGYSHIRAGEGRRETKKDGASTPSPLSFTNNQCPLCMSKRTTVGRGPSHLRRSTRSTNVQAVHDRNGEDERPDDLPGDDERPSGLPDADEDSAPVRTSKRARKHRDEVKASARKHRDDVKASAKRRLGVAVGRVRRVVHSMDSSTVTQLRERLSGVGDPTRRKAAAALERLVRFFHARASLLPPIAWCHLTRCAVDPAEATAALATWLELPSIPHTTLSQALFARVTGTLAERLLADHAVEAQPHNLGDNGSSSGRRTDGGSDGIGTTGVTSVGSGPGTNGEGANDDDDDDDDDESSAEEDAWAEDSAKLYGDHPDNARSLAPLIALHAAWRDERGRVLLRAACHDACARMAPLAKRVADALGEKTTLPSATATVASVWDPAAASHAALVAMVEEPLSSDESAEAHASRAEWTAVLFMVALHQDGHREKRWATRRGSSVGRRLAERLQMCEELARLACQWARARAEVAQLRTDGQTFRLTRRLVSGTADALRIVVPCEVKYSVAPDRSTLRHMQCNIVGCKPVRDLRFAPLFRTSGDDAAAGAPGAATPWPPRLSATVTMLTGPAVLERLEVLCAAFELTPHSPLSDASRLGLLRPRHERAVLPESPLGLSSSSSSSSSSSATAGRDVVAASESLRVLTELRVCQTGLAAMNALVVAHQRPDSLYYDSSNAERMAEIRAWFAVVDRYPARAAAPAPEGDRKRTDGAAVSATAVAAAAEAAEPAPTEWSNEAARATAAAAFATLRPILSLELLAQISKAVRELPNLTYTLSFSTGGWRTEYRLERVLGLQFGDAFAQPTPWPRRRRGYVERKELKPCCRRVEFLPAAYDRELDALDTDAHPRFPRVLGQTILSYLNVWCAAADPAPRILIYLEPPRS